MVCPVQSRVLDLKYAIYVYARLYLCANIRRHCRFFRMMFQRLWRVQYRLGNVDGRSYALMSSAHHSSHSVTQMHRPFHMADPWKGSRKPYVPPATAQIISFYLSYNMTDTQPRITLSDFSMASPLIRATITNMQSTMQKLFSFIY